MKINLKCFSTLVTPDTCDYRDSNAYDLVDGQTVEDLIDRAGIDRNDVRIAFVNNRKVKTDTVLSEGDRVGLSPAVG